MSPGLSPPLAAAVGVPHWRRLREVHHRSAGWPCRDSIEIELVAAGLLEREKGSRGQETLRVSDAGIAVLAETPGKNRARRDGHESLVERVADLLADLRRAAKREAYLPIGGECWYVIREGIAEAAEIPSECGALVSTGERLEVARPAPTGSLRLPFATWIALARATPIEGGRLDDAQGVLGDEPPVPPSGSPQ